MEGIDRIKVLASEITNKATLKVIDYLLSRTDMNDKYLNEEKTLKQMFNYIKSEAKKQAEDGASMIEEDEVYNWAIHYFDETNEALGLAPKKQEAVEEDVVEDKMQNQTIDEMIEEEIKEEQQEEIKSTSGNKIKSKWVAEGQISIFDL